MASFEIPPFQPHPLLRGGHAQTLAGAFLPFRKPAYRATQRHVTLADGDQLVLHDDCPSGWQAGDRSALLVHGLAGCHESGYLQRIAGKLNARGVRVFRVDLRGCGAGVSLARLPYHSGRSDDLAAALAAIALWHPDSPTTLVGFSLGANMTLKLLGELADRPCGNLDSGMAVCPPVDLAACSRRIGESANRLYDRYFVRLLLRQLASPARSPQAASARFARPPRSLWEFDDQFTAVVCGYGNAENYYRSASAAPWLTHIRVPALILAAADDPMICCHVLRQAHLPSAVQLHISEHGGHLGFVGRRGPEGDARWMEWRVVDWVTSRQPSRRPVARQGSVGQTPAQI